MSITPAINEEYPLPIFEYTHNSLKTLSFALSELLVFTQIRDTRAKHFVNSQIMKNYHFTLMYTFVLEYCKLTEKSQNPKNDKPLNGNNYSGLQKLNQIVYESIGTEYQNKFDEINITIDIVLNSPLCEKIRALRDKKIAHTDRTNDYSFTFEMYYFTGEEINEIWKHFYSFRGVLNACASPYVSKNSNKLLNHPLYEHFSKSVSFFDSVDYSKTLQEIEEYAMYENFYNQNNKENNSHMIK